MSSTLEQLLPDPSEQIRYVQCGLCSTILLVRSYYNKIIYCSFLFGSVELMIVLYYIIRTGKCAIQQLVDGGERKMRQLHWPPLRQHGEALFYPF